MKKAKVTFTQCIQFSQEAGSNDEHMVSRIYFTLEIGKERYQNLYTDIKQTVGSDFQTGAIEVSPPKGYEGPFSYAAFREGAERYYRSSFGAQGTGFNFGSGGKISMRNNVVIKEMVIEFEISSSHSPW